MYIKEYEKFICNNYYHPIHNMVYKNIMYISRFLREGFPRMYNLGITNYIDDLKTSYKDGMSFESVSLNLDQEKNVIYLSEPYFEYIERATHNTAELMDSAHTLELCRLKLINYITMT